MADAGSEAESAAERLEAALERIAQLAARPGAAASPVLPEITDRLDTLIAQLRQALDGPPP